MQQVERLIRKNCSQFLSALLKMDILIELDG